MTDDYIERRKRYVQEIRKSFADREAESSSLSGFHAKTENTYEDELETVGEAAIWKVKILLAVMLFAAFVFCDRTDSEIFSMKTDTIIQKIGENPKLPAQIEDTLKEVFANAKTGT